MSDYAHLIIYPATHYALIAATVVLYVFVEVRGSPSKEKVAAGCATVLFCLSLIDAEKAWTGATSESPARQLLEVLILYFTSPVTNVLVVYILMKNVFGTRPINAWLYTLLCIVHAPLSAHALYVGH